MEDVRKYLEEGRAIDLFVAYRFLRILTTPWEDQDAFTHGIIDKDGKLLRKHNELKTSEEKESFTLLHRLIFNLKRILHKIPGVRTKIGTYATALYLLKQHMASDEEQERMIEKAFYNYLADNGYIDPEEILEEKTMKSKEKEPKEKIDSKTIQRWSVWTQGPDDALEKKMKRQYKNSTPGQERDYAKLVGNRKFQKFEQVEEVKLQDEDAVANAVAHGGVDMAPNAKGTKVWLKRKRKSEIDGRTKAYRAVTKRIKERNTKAQAKEVERKLGQFGVTSNPFKEEAEMDNKYLETKKDSIEDAVTQTVDKDQDFINPNTGRTTLTLPKNRYLKSREGSIEDAVESIIVESKPSDKEVRMAKGIANDPRHKAGDMTGAWKKAEKIKKGLGDHPKVQKALRKANEESELDEKSGEKEQKSKMNRRQKKWDRASKDDNLDDVDPKELKGKWKDREDKDIDNDGDKDDSDKYLHKRRKAISKDIKDQDKDPVGKKHESKEVERGERDVASNAYTNYVKSLTPGEKPEINVTDVDAVKHDVRNKKENKLKNRQSTVIDDDVDHSLEEADSRQQRAMKDREKNSFERQKFALDKRHRQKMDRIGDRTSSTEKASGSGSKEGGRTSLGKQYESIEEAAEAVNEIHSSKDRTEVDAAIAAWKKAGGEVKKLGKGTKLKGMDPRRKKLHKALKKENMALAPKGKGSKAAKKLYAKEELPVGHRQPSPGQDSTDSYAKMQAAKRKAKSAGDKEDNWQKYHEDYATPTYASNLTDKEIGRKAAASRKLRRTTQQKARDKRKADTGFTRGFSRAK